MLRVRNKVFMLCVIMTNVIMLNIASVMAPFLDVLISPQNVQMSKTFSNTCGLYYKRFTIVNLFGA